MINSANSAMKTLIEAIYGIKWDSNDEDTLEKKLSAYVQEAANMNNINISLNLDENISNLKSVNINEIKKFHEDFYGANEATFSIVGDFDEKDMKALVEKEFGTWKSKKEIF